MSLEGWGPLVVLPADPRARDGALVGGKGRLLAALAGEGVTVPDAALVTTAAYRSFVARGGMVDALRFELGRKPLESMRWEELWDAALRIRSLFLRVPWPEGLAEELWTALAPVAGGLFVAVRSSAPDEDGTRASFAGLHESVLNLQGRTAILEGIRTVWASLWSDAALMYRCELGLDPSRSAMACVVQPLVAARRAGVAFSVAPEGGGRALVEAVWGLGQGLVEGTVEPDRWSVDRETREVGDHRAPARLHRVVARPLGGTERQELPLSLSSRPPLSSDEVVRVVDLACGAEVIVGGAVDLEWAMDGSDRLVALQARPVTTLSPASEDGRRWYMSLRRPFDDLLELWRRVEGELLPAMDVAARGLGEEDLARLDDAALSAAIDARRALHRGFVERYWDECIPLAHGVRLFGQVYDDLVRPADPHEFLDVLVGDDLAALRRNALIEGLADLVRGGRDPREPSLEPRVDEARQSLVDLGSPPMEREDLMGLVEELARGPARPRRRAAVDLEAAFMEAVPEADRARAGRLVELARAAHRLRDDDNVHLGLVAAQVERAATEGRRRLAAAGRPVQGLDPRAVAAVLRGEAATEPEAPPRSSPRMGAGTAGGTLPPGLRARPRQLQGQPAGRGLATGPARVLRCRDDLRRVRRGEVIVTDVMEPSMTFVVPLVAGIVERRGGMLVHSAIVAREYGIPCVNGVSDAIGAIADGDRVTVDGWLGLVVVDA